MSGSSSITIKSDNAAEVQKFKDAYSADRGYTIVEVKDPTTGLVTSLNALTVTMVALECGLKNAAIQDEAFKAAYAEQAAQLATLEMLNKGMEAVQYRTPKDDGSSEILADKQADLKAALDKAGVSYDDVNFKKVPGQTIEDWRSKLTSAQSTETSNNETLSMQLSAITNDRAAAFTQLHTLLQILMQLNQKLTNW